MPYCYEWVPPSKNMKIYNWILLDWLIRLRRCRPQNSTCITLPNKLMKWTIPKLYRHLNCQPEIALDDMPQNVRRHGNGAAPAKTISNTRLFDLPTMQSVRPTHKKPNKHILHFHFVSGHTKPIKYIIYKQYLTNWYLRTGSAHTSARILATVCIKFFSFFSVHLSFVLGHFFWGK